VEFFGNLSQLSERSGAHKLFLQIFGLFATFDRNFAKIVTWRRKWKLSSESEMAIPSQKW